MIDIRSNGSKWAGMAPDSIEVLIERLGEYALDWERFEHCYNAEPEFLKEPHHRPGVWSFFGDFRELSAVFNILTDEPGLIAELKKLTFILITTTLNSIHKTESLLRFLYAWKFNI